MDIIYGTVVTDIHNIYAGNGPNSCLARPLIMRFKTFYSEDEGGLCFLVLVTLSAFNSPTFSLC